MRRNADAIVIGAGVIGAVDGVRARQARLQDPEHRQVAGAGYGPTSNSCSIVRAHYSSRDGVAMAYEGFCYWQDWANYLGVEDDHGMPRYMDCGTVLLKSATGTTRRCSSTTATSGSSTRSGTSRRSPSAPGLRHPRFWPPKRPDDPEFWASPTRSSGRDLHPRLGLHERPAAGHPQPPARRRGAGRRVPVPARGGRDPTRGGRVQGVTLDDGTEIDAPVVVNVAGPHSFVINRMAGVEDEMNVGRARCATRSTTSLAPATSTSSRTASTPPTATRHLLPARVRQPHPDRQRGPGVRPAGVGRQPRQYDRDVTEAQWEAQVYRLARRMRSLIPNGARHRRPLRRLRRLDPDLRPLRPRRLLHGDRDERQPVQEPPVVGHLMAELIDACEAGHDHDTDPVKVKRPSPGHELDAGFYSRLREINPTRASRSTG